MFIFVLLFFIIHSYVFKVVPDIKKSSGIPQSFMTPVEDASAPGALMTPAGTFAVPTIDL